MSNYFRTDGWVKSSLGPAIPGTQIYVCTQPANVASVPPSPLAMIFSDPNGLVPITQPIITDGFGHYDFYTTPGVYTLVVGLGGIVQQVYPDQSVGGFGSGGSLVLQVNSAPLSSQLTANFTGAGSVSVADAGSGNIVITGAVPPPFPTLPTYISTRWSLWTPANTSATISWDVTNDFVGAQDQGATSSFAAPTSASNYALVLTGKRSYYGVPFVYGGRNFTFNTTALGGGNPTSLLASYFIMGVTDETGLQALPNLNSALLTGNFAVFYKTVGSLVWSCVVGNGASITGFTTSVSVSARHELEIDYTPTAAIFKIDGVVVATLTTTLPTTGSMFMLEASTYYGGDNLAVLTSEYMFCQNTAI